MPRPEAYRFGCDPEETQRNYYTSAHDGALSSLTLTLTLSLSSSPSFFAGRDAFVEAYQRDTGAARKRRVTRVISTMETKPRARAVPGGVGVSALGSKVRDYNIPGMPFRVHQFGTPVPSLRSSRRRVRERASLLSLPLPALPCQRVCGPFQTSAKLRGSASRLCSLLPLFLPRLCSVLERTRRAVRSFPGRTRYPGIGKCLLTFPRSLSPPPLPPAPFFLYPYAYVNCTKSFFWNCINMGVYFGRSCYISVFC